MHFLSLLLLAFSLLTLFLGLAAAGRAWFGWVAAVAGALWLWSLSTPSSPLLFWSVTGVFAAVAAVTGIVPLRRALLGKTVLKLVGGILPKMSETERAALEALQEIRVFTDPAPQSDQQQPR